MEPSQRNRRLTGWGLTAAAAVIALLIGILFMRAKVSGETPEQRIGAIRKMVAERPFGAASALSRAAREDPAGEVRAAALDGLARLGGMSGDTFRIAAADRDPAVRAAAVKALATISEDWAVAALGELASGDPGETVRLAAVDALKTCPANEAVVALVQLLDNRGAPDDARAAVASALRTRCRISIPSPRPADGAAWDAAVDRYKADKVVRDAYAALGKPPPAHRPLPEPDRMGE